MCTFKKVIYKCLKALDCNFQEFLNNKNERIKVQKYSYILEKVFGLSVGTFRLYLNGPYNSKLADEIYEIARNEQDYINAQNNSLQDCTTGILTQIRNNFNYIDQMSEVDILELYTTYDYIKNNISFINDDEAFARLEKEKSHLFERYSDENIDIRNIIRTIDFNLNNLIACS